MTEKGTYSDPRCATCNPPGWDEVDGVKLPPITWGAPAWMTGDYSQPPIPLDMSEYRVYDPAEEQGPRPYHRGRFASTWAERLASAEARYDIAMNKLADAVNARIPAPDVLRNARAE